MSDTLKTVLLSPTQAKLRLDTFEVSLSQAKAGWFLAAMADAAQQGIGLTSAELAMVWKQQSLGSKPTRTDVTRMLRALQVGLAQLASLSGLEMTISIVHAPRQATTGPWRLVVGNGWQVQVANGTDANTTQIRNSSEEYALLALSEAPCPILWARVAHHLARVDSLINEGYYADALALLEISPDAQLSPQMRLIQALRRARLLRRLGRYADAIQVTAALLLDLNTSDLDWRVHAYVRAQHDLIAARNAFDAKPSAASQNTPFERLRETLDCSHNPAMQWEWCNFKALALRRNLDTLVAKTPIKDRESIQAECEELAQKIQALFASAYIWAALAHDMYAAQGIAVNLAYNLQMHTQQGFMGQAANDAQRDYSACLAWYALAHGLVDQFNLPQDSAWDFIMLGELVLTQQDACKQLAQNAAAWPESSSPLRIDFYERSIELASQFGGMRQRVEASNQMVSFLKLISQRATAFEKPPMTAVKQRERITALRQQMHKWMQAEPESAADMLREGFVMQ